MLWLSPLAGGRAVAWSGVSWYSSDMTHQRIETDPAIMQGKPVIRGTRVTVEQIVRECARGLTPADIAEQYPRLAEADVLAALAFAADYLANDITVAAE